MWKNSYHSYLGTVIVPVGVSFSLLMCYSECILRLRDITSLTNVHIVKAMVLSVVIYECGSWIIKAECRRIDAFELWCQRRLLWIPWTEIIPNQSTLKEISPEYSLEGLMLNLKLHCFVHLMWRVDSLEKMLKDWGQEKKGVTEDEMVGWHYWLNCHDFEQTQGDSDGQWSLECCNPWGPKELDMSEQVNNNKIKLYSLK